jgi:hypothetical protein
MLIVRKKKITRVHILFLFVERVQEPHVISCYVAMYYVFFLSNTELLLPNRFKE